MACNHCRNSDHTHVEPLFMELWDAAILLAVSSKTVRRMCQAGHLPHAHVGPQKMYRVTRPPAGVSWAAWLEQHLQKPFGCASCRGAAGAAPPGELAELGAGM
jgi:hypothetical protein